MVLERLNEIHYELSPPAVFTVAQALYETADGNWRCPHTPPSPQAATRHFMGKTIHMASRAFKISLPSFTPDHWNRQCPAEEVMCKYKL